MILNLMSIKFMKAVIALQKHAVDQSIKVSTLLLYAYALASKLSLEEHKQEFLSEIEGYYTFYDDTIPLYRNIQGTLHLLNTSTGNTTLLNGIPQLESMLIKDGIIVLEETHFDEKNNVRIKCGKEVVDFFESKADVDPNHCFVLVVGKFRFLSILQSIRMKVLDFALNLEKEGVLGEEWEFSVIEKEHILNVHYNIETVNNMANHNIDSSIGRD